MVRVLRLHGGLPRGSIYTTIMELGSTSHNKDIHYHYLPRGSIYTTIMELGSTSHNKDIHYHYLPRGSIYTTIMELGSRSHIKDGLLGPNSIMVVCMDPLG